MRVRRRTSTRMRWRPRLGWLRPGAWLGKLSGGKDRRLFIGTFVLFLITGYTAAVLVLFPAPIFTASTTIPDMIDMAESEAAALLDRAGLVAGDGERVNHPSVPSGDVVWQDPPPTLVVPEGTTVELSVSQGPQQIPVPDVANYTGDIAALLIRSAGLAVRVDSIATPAARGLAVNTRPATGTTRRPGDTVRLLVSLGAPTIPVPNLVGLTLDQAQDTLQTLDLIMGRFIPGRPRNGEPGLIYQQAPRAGTLAALGTVVTGWVVGQPQ